MRGLLLLALVGCQLGDNSIPADAAPDDSVQSGYDPQVSRCCDWFYAPWMESPQSCLDEHSDVGECRWLNCLGGLITYHTTGCR